ncbi:hypothetical protein I2483_05965 [Sporosarcina sp. E16_3]|uniref:hypothetical protein n=1 Tax=Sporosarcina sp. E16_3 TaxID=2789293 RepID=UPI001A91E528|nr:hypothetical protein [Sporosarcina sp. E16_3]MBO0601199.1 hypothetical protein [Sporosarcina sp. E16_3]
MAEVLTSFDENYSEESRVSDLPESSPPKPLELDCSEVVVLRMTGHEQIEKSV